MTLRQIDAFRAVMLSGTATEAAQMLGISQPAVSRLVSDLESELALKLFERSGRRLFPTDEAKALFEEVRLAFIGLDRIKSAAEAIRNFQHTQLRLVAIPSVADSFVVDVIEAFGRSHPKAAVSLEVQPSDGAVEWILSQQCDLGFANPPQSNPAIAHRLLKSGPSVCLLPAGHRLCDRAVIRPEMLEGEGFISFRPDSVYRYRVEEVMRQAEVRRVMRYEARTTDAVCGLVSAGLGLAVVGPFLPRFRVDDRIVVKPFRPVIEVELSLLWSSQRPLSAIAERFVQEVDAYFADPAIDRSPHCN